MGRIRLTRGFPRLLLFTGRRSKLQALQDNPVLKVFLRRAKEHFS